MVATALNKLGVEPNVRQHAVYGGGSQMLQQQYHRTKREIKDKRRVLINDDPDDALSWVMFCDKCENLITVLAAHADAVEALVQICPTCRRERNENGEVDLIGEI